MPYKDGDGDLSNEPSENEKDKLLESSAEKEQNSDGTEERQPGNLTYKSSELKEEQKQGMVPNKFKLNKAEVADKDKYQPKNLERGKKL